MQDTDLDLGGCASPRANGRSNDRRRIVVKPSARRLRRGLRRQLALEELPFSKGIRRLGYSQCNLSSAKILSSVKAGNADYHNYTSSQRRHESGTLPATRQEPNP